MQSAGAQAPPTIAQRVASAADSAILRAIRLPEIFERTRAVGVSDSSVRSILDVLRGSGLPAESAAAVVEEEVLALEAGQPKENFGEFVRAQVKSGVSGRELAARIRAERTARGFDRPKNEARGKSEEARGKADSARGRRP